ncbi:hypothetical protein HOL21_01245 [Candidatus Woesearchaeota archaeon]|jgi:hypothetical protein|nr:hypothetical protein [Candidatus Woesearchaeota archaeon]MBT5396818.1 hypothetical protein [Candidatus Woesearchaeota archaeon]MBT6367706.1 hypothetical protein [Candidatus Woesearchaeota archaeon]MBT7762893.1 hypothetical protein [Candidatus Woesearchaeota archaeon]
MKTYNVKSITLSRKPGKDKEGFWTAFIGLFNENNPHLKAKVPFEVLNIPDVEKVRIHELRNISYYLMGNDIIINNLEELTIEKKDNILILQGKQDLPEE